MSLRIRILLIGVGIAILAMALLGGLLVRSHRDTYLAEAELRARTFLAVLAVETTGHLASSRIESLDGVLATLIERDLDLLDIRFVAVLDSDGRIVGHTDPQQYGSITRDPFIMEAVFSPESIVQKEVREGKELLLVSALVSTGIPGKPGLRWGTAIAGIGLDRVKASLFKLVFQAVMTIFLVMAVVTIVLYIMLSRVVVRPIHSLTRAAREFASGDLSTRAHISSQDELAQLGITFNDMAQHIQANTVRLEDEIKDRNRELEEANARLKELATTDGLTKLYNYRHFEETLRMELRRSQRLKIPLSLLMIDVDHFKQFNDLHGHPAGDGVLRELARLIRERIRTTDIPCRYGGEEFTAILPGTGMTDAVILAEQLRLLVAKHPFDGEEEQPEGSLTISIGVSSFPDRAGDEMSLVRTADEALYEAKRSGRNCVRTTES